jgi:hypothetical protein
VADVPELFRNAGISVSEHIGTVRGTLEAGEDGSRNARRDQPLLSDQERTVARRRTPGSRIDDNFSHLFDDGGDCGGGDCAPRESTRR